MDRIDTMLEEFFKPAAPPKLSERLLGGLRTRPAGLEKLAGRFRIEATERGVVRLHPGRGDHGSSARARAHAERARQELREYLAGRRTFFTTGEDESRAWSFRAGAKAPECAGVIHSDLQRGFIRAEVIDWRELLDIGSWDKAKELGKLRVEGKEYEVLDGDVLEIRFNV